MSCFVSAVRITTAPKGSRSAPLSQTTPTQRFGSSTPPSKPVSRQSSRPHTQSRASTHKDDNSDALSNVTTASKANMGFLKSQLSAYDKSQQ